MEMKQLPEDFKDFIKFLNEHNVKYLLLGGWAEGINGKPRETKDIEYHLAIDEDNINANKCIDVSAKKVWFFKFCTKLM